MEKKISPFLSFGEMKIKTSMGYHLTSIKLATKKKNSDAEKKFGKNMSKAEYAIYTQNN